MKITVILKEYSEFLNEIFHVLTLSESSYYYFQEVEKTRQTQGKSKPTIIPPPISMYIIPIFMGVFSEEMIVLSNLNLQFKLTTVL